MSIMIVYHGGTERVESPICGFGRNNLDFGRGFYVTDLREQAVMWASNMARNRKKRPVLNRYRLDIEAVLKSSDARYSKHMMQNGWNSLWQTVRVRTLQENLILSRVA